MFLPVLLLIVYRILSAGTWHLLQRYELVGPCICFSSQAEGAKTRIAKTKSLLLQQSRVADIMTIAMGKSIGDRTLTNRQFTPNLGVLLAAQPLVVLPSSYRAFLQCLLKCVTQHSNLLV